MCYESDRVAVFAKMTFHRDLRHYADFLEALHNFYSEYPDYTITVENLNAAERKIAHDQFFEISERRIYLGWAPTLPCYDIPIFSEEKLRSMISGCQIFRIELFPVFIADLQDVMNASQDQLYYLYQYLRICERRFDIYLNPSRATELENNDYIQRVCREYLLTD